MRVLLIFCVVLLSTIVIISLCMLLYHIYTKIAAFIISAKTQMSECRKIIESNNKGSYSINSQKKKNIKAFLKDMIKTIINAIKTKPMVLIYISCFSLFLISIIITESSLFPNGIRISAAYYLTILLIILFIVMTLNMAKDKSIIYKIFSLLVLFLFVLLFALISIQIYSVPQSFISYIVAFILFFGVVFYLACIAIRYYKGLMATLTILMAYSIILFFGAIVFGEFYWNNFPKIYSDYIMQINTTNDVWRQLLIVAKIGVSGFFEYPSKEILCKITIIQYITGKFMELFLLGFIAAQFINIKKATDTLNEK
jgi:hypothetical protein